MTTTEFSEQFDIHYDNIASKSAPGLDLYEKSVFLTKAQLELIKNHYKSSGNKYLKGFEGSEKRRVDLKELIKNYKTTQVISSSSNLNDKSYFFEVPNDLFLIVQESCKLDQTKACFLNKITKVIPKTHDEYNIQIENPFKTPDENNVWRMDFSKINNKKIVELISNYKIDSYNLRYIKYPDPIILTKFDGEYNGLSIDGKIDEMTCKLDESIHYEILDRAVEIAVSDYKNIGLQNRVQLNLRNE